jgi:hypothetical protein
MREGLVVDWQTTLLIAKDSTERPIDDSARPFAMRTEKLPALSWCFEISQTPPPKQAIQDSLNYCGIIATLREPFLVLDDQLRVKTANRRF